MSGANIGGSKHLLSLAFYKCTKLEEKKKNSKLGVPHQECLRLFISKKCFDHQEIPLDCYEKSTFNNCFRNNPLKK